MMSSDELAIWCDRLRQSDRVAYEQVFRALHDPLLRYAIRLTNRPAVASDIVQDVFFKLWQVRETLDPNQSLKAFLFRLVRNLAFNHQRDQQVRNEKADLIREIRYRDLVQPDAELDAGRLRKKLDDWIDSLPDRQREVLLLSRFEGLSHSEIAAVMGVSPRTVNNHMVKALKHIRRKLSEYEPDLLS